MPSARRGRSTEGRAEVRRDLVAAAVHLFTERGYDETTIDDIAVAAGVGRRTFFRYFPSKEDAISPDHETALARVAEVFTTAHPDEPTTSLVLRAGETVFDLYTEDPELSVRRFALTHQVPALRDRESASVDHYRRLSRAIGSLSNVSRHYKSKFWASDMHRYKMTLLVSGPEIFSVRNNLRNKKRNFIAGMDELEAWDQQKMQEFQIQPQYLS